MRSKPVNNFQTSQGFTLVELLVGLIISLLIAAIALTYFVSSTRTFNINTAEGFIQENARFSMNVLAKGLRRSGADSLQILRATPLNLFFTDARCTDPDSAADLACTLHNQGENQSDRLAIPYVLEGARTCSGDNVDDNLTIGTEQQIVDVYSIERDADGINNLTCTSNLFDPTANSFTAISASVPLVSGVDFIAYQFGVDTDADFVVDNYQKLEDVTTNALWPAVRSVKIAMLISNGQAIKTAQNTEDKKENRTYTVFGDAISFDDRITRKLYSTTVHIPNSPER